MAKKKTKKVHPPKFSKRKLRRARKTKKQPKKKVSHRTERVSRKSVIDQAQLDTLLKKGEERGFVTTSEILYTFPKIEKNIEVLEEIYDNCVVSSQEKPRILDAILSTFKFTPVK